MSLKNRLMFVLCGVAFFATGLPTLGHAVFEGGASDGDYYDDSGDRYYEDHRMPGAPCRTALSPYLDEDGNARASEVDWPLGTSRAGQIIHTGDDQAAPIQLSDDEADMQPIHPSLRVHGQHEDDRINLIIASQNKAPNKQGNTAPGDTAQSGTPRGGTPRRGGTPSSFYGIDEDVYLNKN